MLKLILALLLSQVPAGPRVAVGPSPEVERMAFTSSPDPEVNKAMKSAALNASMNDNFNATFIELVARKDKKIDAILIAHRIFVYDASGKQIFPRSVK